MSIEAVGRLGDALRRRASRTGIRRGGADDDIAVVELPWIWRSLLPANAALVFPAWVSQEMRAEDGGRSRSLHRSARRPCATSGARAMGSSG